MRPRQSFTLVELLVVMAIIAILAALAIPAMSALLEGDSLTAGAQQIADQVNLARQISTTRNVTVELRIFKMYGTSSSYNNGTYGLGYSAIQAGTYTTTASWVANTAGTNGSGTWTPITRLVRLPQNIVISENTNVSLAFSSFTTNAPLTSTTPGPATNALYYPFEFRPSGDVTPIQSMSNNCLVVLPARYATQSALNSPTVKHYAVIQINPITGTPAVFRP